MSEPGVARGFGSRIASDSFAYGLGGIANQAVAILLVPIYARVLGDEGLGITGVLNSTIALALMVFGLALPQAFIRWYLKEASDHRQRGRILETRRFAASRRIDPPERGRRRRSRLRGRDRSWRSC